MPVTGERKSVKIFASVEVYSGQFIYRPDEIFKAETYLDFLEQTKANNFSAAVKIGKETVKFWFSVFVPVVVANIATIGNQRFFTGLPKPLPRRPSSYWDLTGPDGTEPDLSKPIIASRFLAVLEGRRHSGRHSLEIGIWGLSDSTEVQTILERQVAQLVKRAK